MNNKKSIYIIFAGVAFLVLLISFFIASLLLRGYGTLKTSVLPTDTKYKVGRKEYQGNQEIKLRPGRYVITFKRDLFEEKIVTTIIKKNTVSKIEVIMIPSASLKNKVNSLTKEEEGLIDQNEQLLGAESNKKFLQENPVTSELPITTSKYRVDYAIDDPKNPDKITIEITLFTEALNSTNEEQLKQEALNSIKKYNIPNTDIYWFKGSASDFSN